MKRSKEIQKQRETKFDCMAGRYYHYKATVAVAEAIADSRHGDNVDVLKLSDDIVTHLISNGHLLTLNSHEPMKEGDVNF